MTCVTVDYQSRDAAASYLRMSERGEGSVVTILQLACHLRFEFLTILCFVTWMILSAVRSTWDHLWTPPSSTQWFIELA